MNPDAVSYRGFRYSAEIISHCVWLYHRFPLSFREVQEMMLARGVVVSHETIREYLWRAVDQDGNALDILVQSKRNTKAAKRFLAKLMKSQRRVPRVLVTDKLRSYIAAHRDLMSSVERRQSNYLNNRAENSHQPTRQRERAMKGFRSPGRAQRFLACFSLISPHFRPRRHLLSATEYRTEMRHRFRVWNEVTGLAITP